jgi:hypothetical protein
VAVGDTRIYIHESNGATTQITIDDTIAGRMAEIKGMPAMAPENSPFANHLAQFVGQGGSIEPQMFELPASLFESTRSGEGTHPRGILITTDGVHRMPKETFGGALKSAETARDVVSRLIYISEWTVGLDNESALYVGSGPRGTARRNADGGSPVLWLQDPFSEFQVEFVSEEELTPLQAESALSLQRRAPNASSLVTTRSQTIEATAREDKSSNGVKNDSAVDGLRALEGGVARSPEKDSYSKREKGAADHNNAIDSSGTEAKNPRAADPKAGRAGAAGQLPDGTLKKKSRNVRVQKRAGKGRKGGRKTDDRMGQPELDILISHEPE